MDDATSEIHRRELTPRVASTARELLNKSGLRSGRRIDHFISSPFDAALHDR
jgi:hypothetical protein